MVTRQNKWRDALLRKKMCPRCAKRKLAKTKSGFKSLCVPCLKGQRELMRKRTGATKRYRNAASYREP